MVKPGIYNIIIRVEKSKIWIKIRWKQIWQNQQYNPDYDFLRQVSRRNNPNKKTLIYILYTSLHRNPSIHNPNCKIAWLISVLLLLLLIVPIYLGMCPSVPTHIRPYMSKPSLLLETDDKTMGYVYSGSHTYPGPRLRMFRSWSRTCRQENKRWVLYYANSGM